MNGTFEFTDRHGNTLIISTDDESPGSFGISTRRGESWPAGAVVTFDLDVVQKSRLTSLLLAL